MAAHLDGIDGQVPGKSVTACRSPAKSSGRQVEGDGAAGLGPPGAVPAGRPLGWGTQSLARRTVRADLCCVRVGSSSVIA